MDLANVTIKERFVCNLKLKELCEYFSPKYSTMIWINLESILIKLRKKSLFYYVSVTGQFKHDTELDKLGDDIYWILGKPLHKQPDSTIEFLYKLLIN